MTVCLAMILLAVAHRLAHVLSNLVLIRAGAQVVLQLRCAAWDRLQRLSIAYHDRTRVGESLYRVAYDAHAAQTLLCTAVVPVISGVLILVGVLVVMLRLDVLLTLLTMSIAPLFWFVIRLFGRRINAYSQRYHQSESALVSGVQETLSSMRAVQAFTLEWESGQRFRTQAGESLAANWRLTQAQLWFAACVGLVMTLGTGAVIWVGAHRVLDGRLLLGDILVFLAYLGMLYQPMNAFSQSASIAQSAGAQLRRVFEVLDTEPEVRDRPGARRPAVVRGRIEFDGVTFAYEPARAVLQEIDLVADPGDIVAIVGHTGAGKTTLASLLMRFYDPTQGRLRLDDHDLRDLELDWLRRQVGVVLQDPVLFSGTIADNIACGRAGATPAEIEDAARRAQAEEFIRALPHGYQTHLGERAVNLSGGQRQRLSIARALLKNAPILVLDEPTAALDTETEQALLGCLQELTRQRTTLIIAHRLSTVRFASQIVVLERGRIIERGGHETLLATDSAYRRLYRAQWGTTGEETPAAAGS
ncbi:ABC transporter ATP-binding protein [bacterium]|nr:ABC transporter ATP-binding protein [bacterium]